MVNSINPRGISVKIILLFVIILLLNQVFLPQVVADELEDGPVKISSGDFINVQPGDNTIIFWNFTVLTNERAIYWEIVGYGVYETGWGPNANCTTPILNEEGARYDYECHGYYAKYHVWSVMTVTCSETGQVNNGGDNNNNTPLILLLSIGIPAVSVCAVAVAIVLYLKHKKQKDFF
ncbi:MAG: hypothetical protein ACFFG0_30320 [Candidatus Thorarchaeota archaeon]